MTNIYGWTPTRQQDFLPFSSLGLVPARVTSQHRDLWQVVTLDHQTFDADIVGRLRHDAEHGEFPISGDWVGIEITGATARIHRVLPRYGTLVRKAVGADHRPQVIAANIDQGLLVCALNSDFNARRLERYIALCRAGGVEPIIVLTKVDLVTSIDPYLDALQGLAQGVPVIAISAVSGVGIEKLQSWLVRGQTAALLGSSGAGKSTLLNALAGATIMATSHIRAHDGRGRHTTTHRALVELPTAAL